MVPESFMARSKRKGGRSPTLGKWRSRWHGGFRRRGAAGGGLGALAATGERLGSGGVWRVMRKLPTPIPFRIPEKHRVRSFRPKPPEFPAEPEFPGLGRRLWTARSFRCYTPESPDPTTPKIPFSGGDMYECKRSMVLDKMA